MLNQLNGRIISLKGSVLGFHSLDQFQYEPVEENSPFGYLRSLEDPDIGFVVTSPFLFHPQYEFELEEKDKEELALNESQDALVLSMITLQKPFKKSTINLVAPVVINVNTFEGRQIVLPPHFGYNTKTPLFNKTSANETEGE